jgi:hypothetical protein
MNQRSPLTKNKEPKINISTSNSPNRPTAEKLPVETLAWFQEKKYSFITKLKQTITRLTKLQRLKVEALYSDAYISRTAYAYQLADNR